MVASDSISCPKCGHINEAWRTRCEKCRTGFPAAHVDRFKATRPRWVTLYLCLNVVTNFYFMFRIVYDQQPLFLLALPVGQFIGAEGVWRMKNRGRIIFLFFQGVMILLLIPAAFSNFTLAKGGTLIRLVIELTFFGWLLANGHQFED